MKTFRQFINSRAVYQLDIESHPVAAKPVWTLTHARDGSPVSHGIATLETSTDGMSARITAHEWHGSLTVKVVVGVHPRTTISEGFGIEIVPVPDLSKPLSLVFSSHRDRPI